MSPSEVPDFSRLAQELIGLDGSSVDLTSLATFDYILVEYWADYCAPCKLQKRAVRRFIAEHSQPIQRIALLEVTRDPTQLPEVQF